MADRRQKESRIMYRGSILHVSSWGRLALGLCLLVGLCLALGGQARPAHAQSTLTVTNCSNDSQLQADVNTANSDNAGDTITFSCSGDILLTSTLTISGSMTIDGSGQSVTLDGQNNVEVFDVIPSPASITLNALTIANGSANSAPNGSGGGIWNGATLNITNSTLSNNAAPNGPGGSIWNGGTLSISNSTVSNSTSGEGGGIFNNGPLSSSGSIIAENQNGDCANYGTITDNGYNLESGTSCGFTGTGSLQNKNPQLSALANNGGPTQTMALQQGSPAIDQIPAAKCPATDQRGDTRPDNAETTCDMGAYEFIDPVDSDLALTNVPSAITVDATSPHGAAVTYTPPTATDESGDSPLPTVNCSPASGSTFAIGTTTVTCTASDSDDTNSPVSGSFQVVVVGASGQVTSTISLVNSFGLPADIQAGFDTQLQAVQTDLTNNNPAQACSDLTAFINHVQAQSGKHLTVSQANQLLAAAKQVQAVLGC